jgi:hypothetical protein
MKKGLAGCAGIAMLVVTSAKAGSPIQLSDHQMAVITAGGATAMSAVQTSASGRRTATSTWVSNTAVAGLGTHLAQNRTAVLATGGGNASLGADIFSTSTANGLRASAASTAAATGDLATVSDVAMTTAIDTPAGLGRIGIANSSALASSFSAGKTAR